MCVRVDGILEGQPGNVQTFYMSGCGHIENKILFPFLDVPLSRRLFRDKHTNPSASRRPWRPCIACVTRPRRVTVYLFSPAPCLAWFQVIVKIHNFVTEKDASPIQHVGHAMPANTSCGISLYGWDGTA